MKRTQTFGVAAFTLIEVLVVVAIIALLISILLPSMRMARETARRAGCSSNVRQITMAMLYHANDDKKGTYIYTEGPTDDGLHVIYDRKYLNNAKAAICPSTQNIVDLSKVNPSNPTTTVRDDSGRIVRVVKRYNHLANAAKSRFDNDGGHSYEIFAWHWAGIWLGGLRYDQDVRITIPLTKKPHAQWIVCDMDADPTNGGINVNVGAYGYGNWPDEATNNHGKAGGNMGFLDGHVEFVSQREWVPAHLKSAHLNFPEELARQTYWPNLRKTPRPDGNKGYVWTLN